MSEEESIMKEVVSWAWLLKECFSSLIQNEWDGFIRYQNLFLVDA
jgi:hypothetical protein